MRIYPFITNIYIAKAEKHEPAYDKNADLIKAKTKIIIITDNGQVLGFDGKNFFDKHKQIPENEISDILPIFVYFAEEIISTGGISGNIEDHKEIELKTKCKINGLLINESKKQTNQVVVTIRLNKTEPKKDEYYSQNSLRLLCLKELHKEEAFKNYEIVDKYFNARKIPADLRTEKEKQLLAAFENAKNNREIPEIFLQYSRNCLVFVDFEKAHKALDEAYQFGISEHPGLSAEYFHIRGEIFYVQENPEQALTSFKQAQIAYQQLPYTKEIDIILTMVESRIDSLIIDLAIKEMEEK